jgi:hypothetical protein
MSSQRQQTMSMEKVTEILRQAETLTSQEKVFLAQQLLQQASRASEQVASMPNRTKWLAEHRAQYGGQWVAFDGEQLICHGSNREVLAEARRRGVKVPYVAYVEPLDELPFGGW